VCVCVCDSTAPRSHAPTLLIPLIPCCYNGVMVFGVAQAFINTARKIYEKIEQGVFDVSNESYGIKVGYGAGASGSQTVKPGEAPAGQRNGGCC